MMIIVRTTQDLQNATSELSGKIGFVPTMGALHEGHLSLVKVAKEKADYVAVSIFVNPTQFAPNEDFDSYPRKEEADAKLLEEAGASILFLPTEDVIYPDGKDCAIQTGDAATGLEATFRPTHFAGVVNVVSRLFNAVKPDIAVFGQKDYQQLMVISEMVASENMDIEIIGAPIARDEYGLALSSRNAYLSEDELKIARQLNVIVKNAGDDLDAAKEKLLSIGFDKIDYIEKRWNRILAAAWLGKTRLIDNFEA